MPMPVSVRTSLRALLSACLGLMSGWACSGKTTLVDPTSTRHETGDSGAGGTGADAASAEDRPASGALDIAGRDSPASACGNGRIDREEQCDDGNTLSGDGCSSRCQIESDWPPCWPDRCVVKSRCGDGRRTTDEVCDDGNTSDRDGCSTDCRTIEHGWHCIVPGRWCVPLCGDRLLMGTETCDDGNISDGDGCSIHCLVEPGWDCTAGPCVRLPFDASAFDGPRCGDGILSGAEECDLGALNGVEEYGAGCTADCFSGPYCGDGIVNGPEECDLGIQNGEVAGKDGCTLACSSPHYCGDGIVDTSLNEECDLADWNGEMASSTRA